MKALVLGGAGAVCSETTRDLAETSDFDEIMVGAVDILGISKVEEFSGENTGRAGVGD